MGVNDAVKLNDLTPVNTDGTINEDGEVIVELLNKNGGAEASYYYINWANNGLQDSDPNYNDDLVGWANIDTDTLVDDSVVFIAGQSLWIQGKVGYTFQMKGAVGIKDLTISLNNGHIATGNCFPTELKLNSIIPYNADDSVNEDGEVVVEVLNKNGGAEASYYYINWANNGLEDSDPNYKDDLVGWANIDTDILVDDTLVFAAGQGLWVQGKNGYKLYIPAPSF